MQRVLKPGGTLVFAEHGTAPNIAVRTWQHRLTPLWKRIAGGCHLNRKPDRELRAAGFRIDGLETRYLRGWRPFTFMYEEQASGPLQDAPILHLPHPGPPRHRVKRHAPATPRSPTPPPPP